ncbi:MAG: T9SS type A sorting domain-containing protein [Candidatus Sabulitectum sp.]|nr:T9SS type A sorting domain-containing protein [Candidatus Sabulitectum sp.]
MSKSVDSGQAWTRHTVAAPPGTLCSVRQIAGAPSNTSVAYAITCTGYSSYTYKLYKTTNGGSNWSQLAAGNYSGDPGDIYIDPSNPNKITIGSSTGLHHSTNGGASFSTVASLCVKGLYFSDVLGGLMISSTSGLWIWENCSGTPVYYGEDPGTSDVTCSIQDDNNNILAGTNGRAVWASYSGLSVEEDVFAGLPDAGLTVYPNPVTSSNAVLAFCLTCSSEISVSIYDIFGRAVLCESAGIMNSGKKELPLGIDGLSSGIYFASVVGDGVALSGRFVVYR